MRLKENFILLIFQLRKLCLLRKSAFHILALKLIVTSGNARIHTTISTERIPSFSFHSSRYFSRHSRVFLCIYSSFSPSSFYYISVHFYLILFFLFLLLSLLPFFSLQPSNKLSSHQFLYRPQLTRFIFMVQLAKISSPLSDSLVLVYVAFLFSRDPGEYNAALCESTPLRQMAQSILKKIAQSIQTKK